MGGRGSGRRGHQKARTVEQCQCLDLGKLARKGGFKPGRKGSCPMSWAGRQWVSVAYRVRRTQAGLVLVLAYTYTPWFARAVPVELTVPLETTRLHSGGLRWWGRCPLAAAGRPCRRRVLKLYLPPNARYFGCRHCHGLTYRSCQEHDMRVDALRRNPEALAAMADNLGAAGVGQLSLILKALR